MPEPRMRDPASPESRTPAVAYVDADRAQLRLFESQFGDRFRPYLGLKFFDTNPATGVHDLYGFSVGANFNRYFSLELSGDHYEIFPDISPYGTIGEYGVLAVIPQVRLRYPMFEAYDQPNLINTCDRRNQSTIAPQALILMNNNFVLTQSKLFAARLRNNFSDMPFPGCVGPLRYKDTGALTRDLANLKHAVAKAGASEAFMTAWQDTFSQRDSQYSTSMLRDIERGGRTEVEHILGFMLAKARAAGI